MRFMRVAVLSTTLALALGGCATLDQVGKVASAVTKDFANPVSATDIYRAENVYAATLQLAVDYRRYCWSKPRSRPPAPKPLRRSARPGPSCATTRRSTPAR
jgi:hypothetical protein